MNICLTGPLKRLDKGEAVSGLMEIEGQQVQRRCFRREPMRKPTQPQREQANPEGPLRLAQCAGRSGYPMTPSQEALGFSRHLTRRKHCAQHLKQAVGTISRLHESTSRMPSAQEYPSWRNWKALPCCGASSHKLRRPPA
jgi:hypothetical protein